MKNHGTNDAPYTKMLFAFFQRFFFKLQILVFQKSNNHLLKTIKISPKHHILTRNCYLVSSTLVRNTVRDKWRGVRSALAHHSNWFNFWTRVFERVRSWMDFSRIIFEYINFGLSLSWRFCFSCLITRGFSRNKH